MGAMEDVWKIPMALLGNDLPSSPVYGRDQAQRLGSILSGISLIEIFGVKSRLGQQHVCIIERIPIHSTSFRREEIKGLVSSEKKSFQEMRGCC